MIQPTSHRRTTSVLVLLGAGLLAGAAFVGCTGDEFTTGGQGGGGGTPTTTGATTATGDTTTSTSAGGDCSAGCLDGGACREEQSVEHCGLAGEACEACGPPGNECQEAFCDGDGDCDVRDRPPLSPCSIGACVDGSCKADAEVCLNAVDEDEDGKIGCGDPDCQDAGYECSDGTERGLSGPFLVVAGPGTPSCPQGLEQVGGLHYAIDSGNCGCTGACEVEVDRGAVAACIGADTEVLAPGDCVAWPTNAAQALAVTPSCTATSSPAVDVIALATCNLPGFGCDEGEACMPPLPEPGAGRNLLCITAPEGTGCPSGGWNIRPVGFERPDVACECECELDAEQACAGAVSTWTDRDCSLCGEDGERCSEVPVPAECTQLGETAASHVRFDLDAEEPPAASGAPRLGGAATNFCCVEYPQTL